MKRLTKDEFVNLKKSQELVILGCGASINDLTKSQLKKIKDKDSLAFNWFCKHKSLAPTFYLIREQANIEKRISKDETTEILFQAINRDFYKDTCFIVHDMKHHSPHAYSYPDNLDRIQGQGIVIRDNNPTQDGRKASIRDDIFDTGIFHGKTTITNALHIAAYLQYKKVWFIGVDLYDSRYFWMPKEVRSNIKRKGRTNDKTHPAVKHTCDAVSSFNKMFSKVKLRVANPRSLLKSARGVSYEKI